MEKQLSMANAFPSNPLYTRLCNFLLLLLLLFNILFLLLLAKHHQLSKSGATNNNLKVVGWSRKAAEEAEAAALYHCSGHGYVFVDSLTPACECNDCYTGPGCSETVPNCIVDADDGDPVFLEPCWIANAEVGTTVVPAWYRMSYRISDSVNIMISPELEKQIRAIHALVGNAVTEGRYIVVGVGSTHLINAAVNSLSPTDARNPAGVVAASPYYGVTIYYRVRDITKQSGCCATQRGFKGEKCQGCVRSRLLLASLYRNHPPCGRRCYAFHPLQTHWPCRL